MTLTKIISGGQTGADQGALRAAKELGLATGGYAPRGWRTDAGPMPELGPIYGLFEHSSDQYSGRTLANVLSADATLIFGNSESPGCRLTRRYAKQHRQILYTVYWYYRRPELSHTKDATAADFASWLQRHSVSVLNVAGNRERTNPGIADATRRYIVAVVTQMRMTQQDENGG